MPSSLDAEGQWGQWAGPWGVGKVSEVPAHVTRLREMSEHGERTPLGADAEGWGGDKLAVLAPSSMGRPFLGVASREHEALGLPGRAKGFQEGGSGARLQQVEGRSPGQGGLRSWGPQVSSRSTKGSGPQWSRNHVKLASASPGPECQQLRHTEHPCVPGTVPASSLYQWGHSHQQHPQWDSRTQRPAFQAHGGPGIGK